MAFQLYIVDFAHTYVVSTQLHKLHYYACTYLCGKFYAFMYIVRKCTVHIYVLVTFYPENNDRTNGSHSVKKIIIMTFLFAGSIVILAYGVQIIYVGKNIQCIYVHCACIYFYTASVLFSCILTYICAYVCMDICMYVCM